LESQIKVKSHIISKAQIIDFLESLLTDDCEFTITENIFGPDPDAKKPRWVIKNKKDLKAFLGKNFCIKTEDQSMKSLETYWSKIENDFSRFSRKLKKFIREYPKSGDDVREKNKINNYILENQKLIILYSLICMQREYIRFYYKNHLDFKDLLFEVEYCINNGPFNYIKENRYMNMFYDYYNDLMNNFDIRIVNSYHGTVLYDPSFIMTTEYLLIMYQSFGSIVFLKKNSEYSQKLDEQVNNKKNSCIVSATSREEADSMQGKMYNWVKTEFDLSSFGTKIVYKIELNNRKKV
jgi:hypothetical protein